MFHLSLLDNDIFPPPKLRTLASRGAPPSTTAKITPLMPNYQVTMYPPAEGGMLPDHPKDRLFPGTAEELVSAQVEAFAAMPDFAKAIQVACKAVRADPLWETKQDFPGHDITVTTLGTGSAIPSKYRNVSSTHAHIPKVGGVLLDTGEGTLGQLRRHFGPDLLSVHQQLKLIFISHMHADHQLGLQLIIEDRLRVYYRLDKVIMINTDMISWEFPLRYTSLAPTSWLWASQSLDRGSGLGLKRH
jgi:ribonuclease Z